VQGKRVTFRCDDSELNAEAEKQGSEAITVKYSSSGTTVGLTYTVKLDAIRCDISILEEDELKIDSVGDDAIFGVALGPGDYGIVPSGHLVRPAKDQPFAFHRRGNSDNTVPNFSAVRAGKTIVYCNPLTYSQTMHVQAQQAQGADLVHLGATLHFRPPGFKNPKTKLVHDKLSWRIELASDENRDGEVDWVDCGIAYRERYLKSNPDKCPLMRDSYRFYHQYGPEPNHYKHLAAVIERMDFATGIWWVKGAMVTNHRQPSEFHPYWVERSGMGDKAEYAGRIRATGSRVGIYYGHDYIDYKDGGWPEELVKLDPDGQPHRYSRMHYKDNVRGLATGKLLEHYDRIIEVVRLQRGDPVQLDTFTAYARPGYHADYPATPQNETEAKREIARWLKYDRGLIIAGEGIIEGTQDVMDYGSIVYKFRRLGSFWRTELPRQFVPLMTVIYHGSTYCGCNWYELRNRTPNWAAVMAICGAQWDWDSRHYPDHVYEKAARYFFNTDIFWSQIADRKIVDVDQKGTEYTVRFDDGSMIRTDPEESIHSYWLEKDGIRYDGFTPFSTKGVMAILKQGDFDVALPVRDDLEVLPSQPYRDRLDVKITRAKDGFVRVHGNFSKIPWKLPYLHSRNGKEVTDIIDVEPVLMLRRKL